MNREEATAIQHKRNMAVDHNSHSSLLDSLYCHEEEHEQEQSEIIILKNLSFFPLLLFEQDFLWEDEELQSLLSKEREASLQTGPCSLSPKRNDAVQWILKIKAHYGFSALTAILAVNYLDRFLSNCLNFQKDDKPWMMHLAAVACLSLAAKVEETHVPLLLDLQVEDTKYLFEAKTIQRMELLVLSALKWRMNPVTAISFLDHIVRRLGLKSYIHFEFLKSCESLVLSIIADSRFARYLPSVLATATIVHVIHQVEPCNVAIDYENQLLAVLKISKEEVDDCNKLILDIVSRSGKLQGNKNALKRKICPSSSGVIIDTIISCDISSNDSGGVSSSCISSSSSPIFKKRRVQEQQMKLPSLSRVFVDAIESPH